MSAKMSAAPRIETVELNEANGESPASASPPPPPAKTSPKATTINGIAQVNSEANNHSYLPASAPIIVPQPRLNYENCNLDEITMRQLSEDIDAYNHDLAFCHAQLAQDDLTPQESRTLQLRVLDLSHQIRHCRHRIETMRVQMRGRPLRPGFNSSLANGGTASTPSNWTINKPTIKPLPATAGMKHTTAAHQDADPTPAKRPKLSPGPGGTTEVVSPPSGPVDNEDVAENTSLQRLGYWQCRLCESTKYLLAPSGRTPAMPCKWPLRDISKMITHFTEMHKEHSPSERCVELGTALDKNRGPFEYWLRKTKSRDISDGSCIQECIGELLYGRMPEFLRGLSRAAAGMPAED